jgi:hypothetical protein
MPETPGEKRPKGRSEMSRNSRLALPGLALAAALAAPAANAQLPDYTFALTAGWFLQSAEANVRVDGSVSGTPIDLGDLGIDSSDSSYLVGGEWRFAERHRIGLYSFAIKRDASKTITKSITIGDTTYPVGVSLSSSFDTTVTPIAYMYSFTKERDSELAGTVGVHWSKLELTTTGATSLGGSVTRSASAKVDAPLPLLGLRYDRAIDPNWKWSLGGQYFYLKAGEAKGWFGLLNIATDYAFTKNLAVGASYTYFKMQADADSDNWKGQADYEYYGPAVYLVARF